MYESRIENSRRLWITFVWVLVGTIVSQLLAGAALLALGYSMEEISSNVSALTPGALMVMLGITQLLGYLVPGMVSAYSLFKSSWLRETQLWPLPSLKVVGIGILAFALTIPLTGALAQLNASIDLASWQSAIESSVADTLTTIIVDSQGPMFILALILIAVLPALGEELVFRGLIQPALIRTTRSTHLGIWLTAAAFALVHLQFAGLLPRLFLGAVLGFLGYYSQRLWVPVLAHFVFNGIQVVGLRMGMIEGEAPSKTVLDLESVWLLLAGIIFASVAAFLFRFLIPEEGLPPTIQEPKSNNDIPN